MKYFRGSFLFAAIVLAAVYISTGSVELLLAAFTLSLVEISVSFDNAAVNAKIIHNMSPFWKKMFLTVGILIAVVGMRFYLPIQIVSLLAGIGLGESFQLATRAPSEFAKVLFDSKAMVAGAGGSFLMLVALDYFMDIEKDNHWFDALEDLFAKMGGLDKIQILIVGLGAYIFSTYLGDKGPQFFTASLIGIAVYIAIGVVKSIMEKIDEHMAAKAGVVAKAGFGSFLYLEVLDASFSFDGVIAAFAITDHIFVIAAGLGIGAYFVRSITIYLDEKGALQEYKYLEPGAFYAIIGLSLFMWFGTIYEIHEWIIAVYSVAVLGAAFAHSLYENRKDETEPMLLTEIVE